MSAPAPLQSAPALRWQWAHDEHRPNCLANWRQNNQDCARRQQTAGDECLGSVDALYCRGGASLLGASFGGCAPQQPISASIGEVAATPNLLPPEAAELLDQQSDLPISRRAPSGSDRRVRTGTGRAFSGSSGAVVAD